MEELIRWANEQMEDARWEEEYDLQKGAIESSKYNKGRGDAFKAIIDALKSRM